MNTGGNHFIPWFENDALHFWLFGLSCFYCDTKRRMVWYRSAQECADVFGLTEDE